MSKETNLKWKRWWNPEKKIRSTETLTSETETDETSPILENFQVVSSKFTQVSCSSTLLREIKRE